ncbi:hypothetical protein K7X08_012066 [Anisodus acutangulus]|uniref:Uncharacterized protein n=1 Tax=Anisodus acutangulus TaxID=402998 RepID=A0A9Q1LC59_9SOLA|nr:hypothetical protein K7X08_012066 [Anisodus acutangulus]
MSVSVSDLADGLSDENEVFDECPQPADSGILDGNSKHVDWVFASNPERNITAQLGYFATMFMVPFTSSVICGLFPVGRICDVHIGVNLENDYIIDTCSGCYTRTCAYLPYESQSPLGPNPFCSYVGNWFDTGQDFKADKGGVDIGIAELREHGGGDLVIEELGALKYTSIRCSASIIFSCCSRAHWIHKVNSLISRRVGRSLGLLVIFLDPFFPFGYICELLLAECPNQIIEALATDQLRYWI